MSYLSEIVQQIEIIQKSIIKQDIEKAWKKHPIGTVITRKDGRKYKKVSETGNSNQDWKLVTGDKSSPEEDSEKRTKNDQQGGAEVNTKELPEQAKNTSETALQNAIKQSPNPEIRQAAHEELERRKNEETPKKTESGERASEKLSQDDIDEINNKLGLDTVREEFHKEILEHPNFKREQRIVVSLSNQLGVKRALECYSAVRKYSTSMYGRMNNSLRVGKEPKDVKLIDSFIDLSPKNSSNVLFRGVGGDFGRTLKEGQRFDDLSFVSTSESRKVAESFAKKRRGYVLEVTGTKDLGVNMPEFWRFDREKGEQEVLLPRGLKFRVDSIDGKNIKISIVDTKKESRVEQNEFVEKFRTLSDEQVKFYLDAPYPKVKEAAKQIIDERGLKVVSKEDYYKQFKDYSDYTDKEIQDYYLEISNNNVFSDFDQIKSLNFYTGSGHKDIREYIVDREIKRIGESPETIKKDIDNISSFIEKNRIDDDLSLHRRVYTSKSGDFFTKLNVGDIYEDKSFSSSSFKKFYQFGDFNINILCKKGSKVANANNVGELEFIIDKGSKFRVLEKDSQGIIVELL